MSVQTPAKSHRNGRPTRVAAVHAYGTQLRVVVVSAKDGVEVLEAVELERSQLGGVRDIAKRHRVERIVGVAPGDQCVCRCMDLPAHSEDLGDTISLLLETQMPGETPANRRAGGVVASGPRGQRVALLTAWNESGRDVLAASEEIDPNSWVAVAAAIQALRAERAGLIAYVDRSNGSISLFATGDRGAVARVLLESNADEHDWGEAIVRAIEETGEAAGTKGDAAGLRVGDRSLLLSSSDASAISARVSGIGRVSTWLDTYGVALGAALVATSPEAYTRSLAELSYATDAAADPLLARSALWLSRPRNAIMACFAALVLMLLVPLAGSWGRAEILDSKVAAAREHEAKTREMARQVAVYKEVGREYWPMTKILADVSRAAPVGMEIDQVVIDQGSDIRIDGRAGTGGDVDAFQSNLNGSGVFDRALTTRNENASAGGVEFSLVATVGNIHANFSGGEDFSEKPLAVHLYGERGSNTNWKPSASFASGSSNRSSERTTARPSGRESSTTRTSSARPSGEVPPPLTEEQLQTTDKLALMKAKIARNAALRNVEDGPDKIRLEDEIAQINARLDALKAGGSP